MPYKSKRPCGKPGCAALTDGGGYCEAHRNGRRQADDRARGSSSARLYGSKWQKARAQYLMDHPLCECDDCEGGAKRIELATVVDHIIPHRGDEKLFWSRRNWQAMAKRCHDRKTAREDGGFGNQRRETAPQ